MTLPVVSVLMKKDKKPSLVLTLSSAGLLIVGGAAAYWLLTQGKPFSRDLLPGANIIPQDALFAVSFTTDSRQWKKLREFGTKETQVELDTNIQQLQERFLTSNGYDFQKDIRPWVGDQIAVAVLAPEMSRATSKPVTTNASVIGNEQSLVMVLPIKNKEAAKTILSQPKAPKGGKWIDRSYENIAIKETEGQAGEKFSVAVVDENFLVITDDSKATEKAINAYKRKTSLADSPGFAENYPKIAHYQPFAEFYVNVPFSAKIAASGDRALPAPVLSQLQNNQGLAGSLSLESEGVRIKGISWLNPNSQRVLATDNNGGKMQNRLPAETLLMLSGGNLKQLWSDYALTSQGNPRSPMTPEQLRDGVKSLTNLDLERDLLSWMGGEFSLSIVPNITKEGLSEDFRAAFVFMVEASDRNRAELALKQLDDVMKTQYQFQIKYTTVANRPVVNWLGPYGTPTATHGWLDGNVAFLALGTPVSERIMPKPNYPLSSTTMFQKTVPKEPNPTNGQFFIDVERTAKNFPLASFVPFKQSWIDATSSMGVTSAVSDNRSIRYDVFLTLKKVEKSDPLPTPTERATPGQ
ncbi:MULTISPECIES: DUF3352 domain-containing protein [Nostocales]|uniref:DUF3352 domain-containing protein n=4 Tax=Nostocales TaxID=1161 RepID=A0A8S9T4Q5_9CYAN|nr:DUF3352 domain-containing protein [Tolypothrix bouteillei]KAF3887440.1 DUF3352 domain-containing protein [Tolypothrix bouteillei VB521301]